MRERERLPHVHATAQLLYFLEGEGIVGTQKERTLFRAGHMVFIPRASGTGTGDPGDRDLSSFHSPWQPDHLAAGCADPGLGDLHGPRRNQLERGAAVHIIRYDQEEAIDSVPILPSLEMRVRLPRPFFNVTAVSPDGNLKARVHTAGGEHRLTLRDVPLYCILWIR